MKNKQQIIFLIIGTLLFSFIICDLAISDYKSKKARFAPNAQTSIETKIYNDPDLKSKIIDSLPKNIDITIGKEHSNFYKIIGSESHPSVKGGFIPKETVIKTR
ncbi:MULTISPECIES: hypothetical protein [unclassified Flavobacterium]|uniref:hypothetical protein n=1 Tax=unclassified Flavobacterium TaxID=196869 RepID=UPI001AC49653|nr:MULTISPECIES: hypothetical protein [unclassified Flavobacterium]MBN9285301.1 hypothetical protein [Flavobacterium sp.]